MTTAEEESFPSGCDLPSALRGTEGPGYVLYERFAERSVDVRESARIERARPKLVRGDEPVDHRREDLGFTRGQVHERTGGRDGLGGLRERGGHATCRGPGRCGRW